MQLKKMCFYLFFVGCTMLGVHAFAQNISNEGTDFWTVFPTHDPAGNMSNSNLATMNVNVTSKFNSEVIVSCGSWTSGAVAIPANTVVTFLVDRQQSYIDYADGNKWLSNRGIHIVVTPGKPKVVAYSHVFAANRSAATLILPVESLGQKYYSMNYTQDNNPIGQNFLVLTAVEDDTRLILHKKNGTTETIDLPKAGDVYEYISTRKEDFTGTFVEVDPVTSPCKRFAAFSGSSSIIIGPCANSRDPLLQQLYSINSWGKNYGIVPFKDRRYIFRVLAQDDNTIVKVNNVVVATLSRGIPYESPIFTTGAIVSADKLISVAQYSLTQACSSIAGTNLIGDPEMVLLNPIEFNIKNITVFSSNRNLILEKYINVFMKSNKTSTFRLNGLAITTPWTTMSSDPTYSYVQLQVFDESLTLTADDGFNAIAYGFGQTESYAYSAGTNLYSTSTISLLNVQTGINTLSSACLGQQTNPRLTVPYLLTSITWDFHDGTTYTDKNPTAPIVTVDNIGNKQYTYTSPAGKIFTTIGAQIITATAILSVDDAPPCFVGTDLEFNFEIEVVPLGVANFEVPDICAGKPVTLVDKSNIVGNIISQWKWDIDGKIYTDQNPTHTFMSQGRYLVKLSVANASGCWSDVTQQTITVTKDFPKLEFNALQPVCFVGNPVQFVASEKIGLTVDASKSFFKSNGKGLTTTGVFSPSIAGVGVHKITYVFSSIQGCTDSISQDIEVYATTVINIPPTVYILSGGQKVIPVKINLPNTNYKYKYKWMPSIGLSSDTVLNPIAFPSVDTKYILTVSIDGYCSVSKEVLVKVLDKVEAPNSFSPNGDGINDVWNIASLDSYPNADIEVFNRNGQKVFVSKGYTVPFDGIYQNKPLPVGVYYYRISPNNGRKTISGALTIIR